MLANTLPWIMLCNVPFNTSLIRNWSHDVKVTFVYLLLACLTYIVEKPRRLSAYMGFLVSKALSQLWSLLKHKKVVNEIPLEKYLGMAIVAGTIGFASVKRARANGSLPESRQVAN